jgi:hypothetical protein
LSPIQYTFPWLRISIPPATDDILKEMIASRAIFQENQGFKAEQKVEAAVARPLKRRRLGVAMQPTAAFSVPRDQFAFLGLAESIQHNVTSHFMLRLWHHFI